MPTDTLTLADAFLADILSAPADDAPRLIYADWLTDNGEEAMGEFIRVQCELAGLPDCGHDYHVREQEVCRRCLLLCLSHDYLANPRNTAGFRLGVDWHWVVENTRLASKNHKTEAVFRRGFVDQVRCSQDEWLLRGSQTVRKCPVTRVDLTDKEVWAGRGAPTDSVAWLRHGYDVNTANMVRHTLDYRLFRKLAVGTVKRSRNIRWYLTPDDATADLSQACLRYARETHP